MMIHEITERVGAHKRRVRYGRGEGSGHGKESGRGTKGARARSGYTERLSREGGQLPFFRRIPKRGFSNDPFRVEYAVVNLADLERLFKAGDEVSPKTLISKHLLRDASMPVKILGHGDLTKKLTVSASAFSASAKAKIESAGGSASVIAGPKKWIRAASKSTAKDSDAKKPS